MPSSKHKFHFLLHAADLLGERLRIQLKPLGIRPRQARVIEALERMGRVSQVTLAREFDVSQASMSTMTTRLISGGLISREADPDDPRGNLLSLTDRGRALLSQINAAWDEVDAIAGDAIGAERFNKLTLEAKTLRDALGGCAPGGDPQTNRSGAGDAPISDRPDQRHSKEKS